jgi:hypothetical protein
MESITNNAEYLLGDWLSFNLPGSGQYVVDRRSVTCQNGASNRYVSGGTRVIKIRLDGEEWLEPFYGSYDA